MTFDIKLTTDRDAEIDTTGDISIVSGSDNKRQQHANAIYAVADELTGEQNNVNIAEELRVRIEEQISEIDNVDSVTVNVTITDQDSFNIHIDSNITEITEEVTV